MGSGFDLLKLMKEAGKLQGAVSSHQEELKKKKFTAEAGAGMVKVTMNGAMELLSITVEPDTVDQLGLNGVLDLSVAAINEVIKKAQDGIKDNMLGVFKNITGDLFGGE